MTWPVMMRVWWQTESRASWQRPPAASNTAGAVNITDKKPTTTNRRQVIRMIVGGRPTLPAPGSVEPS